MQRTRRPLLMTGLIISVVMFSLLTLGCLMILSMSDQYNLGYDIYVGVTYFLLIYCIVGIVFSGIGLSICSKPFPIYKRKSGYIITVFILQCIFFSLGLVNIISQVAVEPEVLLIYLIIALGAVFIIVGHVKVFRYQGEEFSNPFINQFDNAYLNLERIRKLREDNVISEEEYQYLMSKQQNNNY